MGKNFTSYIHNRNADKFFAEKEPNKLINDLLDAHYSKRVTQLPGQTSIADMPVVTDPKMKEDQFALVQPGTERECCSKASRCKHWEWDGDAAVWKNTLSGRTVDA